MSHDCLSGRCGVVGGWSATGGGGGGVSAPRSHPRGGELHTPPLPRTGGKERRRGLQVVSSPLLLWSPTQPEGTAGTQGTGPNPWGHMLPFLYTTES